MLKAKQSGLSYTIVTGIYIFYELAYVLSAYTIGIFADKIGLKKIFISELSLFEIVYLEMGLIINSYFIVKLFLLYGLYAAVTEGFAKS